MSRNRDVHAVRDRAAAPEPSSHEVKDLVKKVGLKAADPEEAAYFAQVGERIRKIGIALGMTPSKQSRDMGISQAALAHWTTARHRPNLFVLSKWCIKRRITADYLFLDDMEGLPKRLHDALVQVDQTDHPVKNRRPGRSSKASSA